MKKIYTLLFFIWLVGFVQAQKIDLALHLEQGKTYKQAIRSLSNISQEVNGQKMEMVITIEGSMAYQVKAVNSAYYDMEMQYERLAMQMQLPQGTMQFSSEKKDEQDLFSEILGQITNKPFAVKMTKRGKIQEVGGLASLFE